MNKPQSLSATDIIYPNSPFDADPFPVLAAWRQQGQRVALLTIVEIDGKSPRSVGARMAVREDGATYGYISGGCIEKELALVAQEAMKVGKNHISRYGRGSPFVDIRLPCGSGIDVYFDQSLDDAVIARGAELVGERAFFKLRSNLETGTSEVVMGTPEERNTPQPTRANGIFERLCKPRVKLRVFGAGTTPVQIALCGRLAGMDVDLVCTDELTSGEAERLGVDARTVSVPSSGLLPGDPFTASIVAFHEHEKEMPLLPKLLEGSDFYVAAIGSARVGDQRRQALVDYGVTPERIEFLRMRPGLIPNARNATELGFGIVSEILKSAREQGLVV